MREGGTGLSMAFRRGNRFAESPQAQLCVSVQWGKSRVSTRLCLGPAWHFPPFRAIHLHLRVDTSSLLECSQRTS